MAPNDHAKGDHVVNVRSVFVLSAVALVSACATPAKGPELAELPVEATVVWGNQGRGGATARIPGYVHALHRGGTVYRDAPTSPEPQPPKAAFVAPGVQLSSSPAVPDVRAVAPSQNSELLPPQTVPAIAAVSARDTRPNTFKVVKAASISDKRHRAWEKYCDSGYGMTDEDSQLVREAGAPENVPGDLAGHCIHPK